MSFDLRNAGTQYGNEIAQVYVTLPTSAEEPFRKLAGWKRISLTPGATQTVSISLNPLYLSIYSPSDDKWTRPAGGFLFEVGGSSADLPLHQTIDLDSASVAAVSLSNK